MLQLLPVDAALAMRSQNAAHIEQAIERVRDEIKEWIEGSF